MAGLAMLVDDYSLALRRLTEARQIAEEIGATQQVGWDIYHMGDVWYNLGNLDEALRHFQQAQSIFETSNHPRGKIRALISLGVVHLALGQMDEASAHLEAALRQAEERGDVGLMFRSYQALSTCYRKLGGEDNLANAVRLSNRIIKLASDEENVEHELLGLYLRATGFFELRNLQEALKSSTRAVQLLEQREFIESPKISVAEIYYAHSTIAGAMGQFDTSRRYFQMAYNDVVRRANLITDDELRNAFLDNIPLNREILALVR